VTVGQHGDATSLIPAGTQRAKVAGADAGIIRLREGRQSASVARRLSSGSRMSSGLRRGAAMSATIRDRLGREVPGISLTAGVRPNGEHDSGRPRWAGGVSAHARAEVSTARRLEILCRRGGRGDTVRVHPTTSRIGETDDGPHSEQPTRRCNP
jgi:hypothetical protein